MKKRKKFAWAAVVLFVVGLTVLWIIGGALISPQPLNVGDPPNDFRAQTVTIKSQSGSTLHGWWIPGQRGKGTVVLMHGVRGSRLGMLERAKFLSREGFGVLLFDFQAHGESSGAHITFGRLESQDASAAVAFARSQVPDEKIGVIGTSLGGASAMLAKPALTVDAMVLESVYPALQQAIEDRLAIRFGQPGKWLAPLLTCQLRPRLGFGVDDLRPIDHAKSLTMAKLFIAGTDDQHTTESESKELFEAAAEPKEFWLVKGAGHVDMRSFNRSEYEKRLLTFLTPQLQSGAQSNQ